MPGLVRDIWMKVRIRKQMELRICNDNAFGNYSVLPCLLYTSDAADE